MSLFFEVYNNVNYCYLSYLNVDLVVAYNVIKTKLDDLINLLKKHQKAHNKEYFYYILKQLSIVDTLLILPLCLASSIEKSPKDKIPNIFTQHALPSLPPFSTLVAVIGSLVYLINDQPKSLLTFAPTTYIY